MFVKERLICYMNKKRLFLYFFFYFLLNNYSFSQYLDYSQYYSSPLSLNPALTGVGEYGRFGIIYRNQWPSISNGYQTFSSWLDYNFDQNNNNIGLIISREKEGYVGLNSNSIGINFANEILLNSNLVIRGGVQFSYNNKNISFNNLVFGDQLTEAGIINDITLESLSFKDRVSFFDLGIGMITYSNKFWIGGSVFNLLEPNISFVGLKESLPKLFSFHGGYSFDLGNSNTSQKTYLTPSINYRRLKKFNQLDIGSHIFFNPISFGFYYRGIPLIKYDNIISHESLIILIGLKYDIIDISYTYDYTISQLNNFSGGSHEISIIYRFNFLGKKLPPKEVRILSCPIPNF